MSTKTSKEIIEENVETVDTSNDQEPIKEEPKQPTTNTGKVANAKFVKLRKSPSSSADVVVVLHEGDNVTIIEKVPGYYHVKVHVKNKAEVGYISSAYLKED